MRQVVLCCVLTIASSAPGSEPEEALFLDEPTKIAEVKEVRSFHALYLDLDKQPPTSRGLIHLTMWIDAKALPVDAETRYPLLDVLRDGNLLATVPIKVAGPTKDGQVVLEWSLSPQIDATSRISFQLHPRTDAARYVSLRISEAEGLFVDGQRKRTKLTYIELQSRAKAAISNVR
jgi:hypothetical protein